MEKIENAINKSGGEKTFDVSKAIAQIEGMKGEENSKVIDIRKRLEAIKKIAAANRDAVVTQDVESMEKELKEISDNFEKAAS